MLEATWSTPTLKYQCITKQRTNKKERERERNGFLFFFFFVDTIASYTMERRRAWRGPDIIRRRLNYTNQTGALRTDLNFLTNITFNYDKLMGNKDSPHQALMHWRWACGLVVEKWISITSKCVDCTFRNEKKKKVGESLPLNVWLSVCVGNTVALRMDIFVNLTQSKTCK